MTPRTTREWAEYFEKQTLHQVVGDHLGTSNTQDIAAKLRKLAEIEDARPEQPEAMGNRKTVGVKWDQTGLVTVLVDGAAQFIFNPAIAKIGYMEGPIQ